MRIVLLGDSLTWGKYGGSYPNALRTLVPEHEFINAGVGGDTVINLQRRLEEDVFSHTPEAVVVMIGGNDAISFTYPETRRYYTQVKHIPNGTVTPDDFEQSYRDVLTQLQTRHIIPWVVLEPNEYSPLLSANTALFNERARQLTESMRVPCLDLPALLNPPTPKERPPLTLDSINLIGRRLKQKWHGYDKEHAEGGYSFTFDGLHPTEAGAQQIAGHIAAFITA